MDQLLTVKEVAKILQVSKPHVYNLFNDKELPLPFVQVSPASKRVRKSDLDGWIEQRVKNHLGTLYTAGLKNEK